MAKDYYDILWVNKSASGDDIKKAYRKKAMEFHPDRNKGDAWAEKKFKEVNEAYDTLWNESKRKNYDMFWSSSWNFYNNASWNASWWFGWFEDLFSQFWWGRAKSSNSAHFDFSDMFGWWASDFTSSRKTEVKEEKASLDIEKTIEIPFFDFLFWTSVLVNNWIGKSVTIKIKEWTKPWTKMRVKWYWRSSWKEIWNLMIKVDAKMPKEISEIDKKMLSSIKDNIWY